MAKHYLSSDDVSFQRKINRTVKQLSPESFPVNSCHRAETGSSATGYYGSFKVINDGTDIKVINGASPDSEFCGITDIKGYILVQTFSLESAKGKKVFIIGLSDGSSYSVQIYLEGNEPSDTYKSDPIQLASVDSDGKVTQDWTDGDIKFSEDYFV